MDCCDCQSNGLSGLPKLWVVITKAMQVANAEQLMVGIVEGNNHPDYLANGPMGYCAIESCNCRSNRILGMLKQFIAMTSEAMDCWDHNCHSNGRCRMKSNCCTATWMLRVK